MPPATDTEDEELGEVVELDAEDSDVEDTPDGGAIVRLSEEADEPGGDETDPEHFYRNLAEEIDEERLDTTARRLIELIKNDKEARKKRDEQYEEGLRRTGLGNDAPGGAQFNGASKVVHPMMTEACIDFASRAIKELFPASGPVKTQVLGKFTRDRVEKAKRKAEFMNWQLTVQSREFRAELEQTLTQVPMGGAGYIKGAWNKAKNRADWVFLGIDEIYLPFAATNFYSANRKTHAFTLTAVEVEQRMASGMYRRLQLPSVSMSPEQSKTQQANDKIEGKEDNQPTNQDGERLIYDVYALIDIEDPDDDLAVDDPPGVEGAETAPYIITIDVTSQKVLAVYRNWDMDDPIAREELDWIIEFPFVPWRGAMPIGLPHMIGGISAAATGSLRALLDSAHINNAATLLKLKGGSRGGQSLSVSVTQVEEIEGGINVDDIRKLAMPMPFNPPSTVLYQLLGFLVDSAKNVIRTTYDDVADSNANVPVGTTLARIEQGAVVFSAIHERLHAAMARLLALLNRLNAWNLDDEATERETGELLASRADFEGPQDVVPVSNPNIFSEAQRFAQIQAVAQRQQANPAMYDARKVEERILETLKIPDPLDLLAKQTKPIEENPISENVKMSLGQPVVAFPEQNHIMHLKAHVSFLVSPVLGKNPLIAPAFTPQVLQHIKEHIVMWYADEAFQMAQAHAPEDFDLKRSMEKFADLDTETKQALDAATAEAGLNVVLEAAEIFGKPEFQAAIGEALQFVQSMTPPMQDPAAQAAMADVQMRERAAAAKNQTEQMKVQLKAQEQQTDQQLRAQEQMARAAADERREELQQQHEGQREVLKQQHEDQRAAERIDADVQMNTQDNETLLEIAGIRERAATVRATIPDPNPPEPPKPPAAGDE